MVRADGGVADSPSSSTIRWDGRCRVSFAAIKSRNWSKISRFFGPQLPCIMASRPSANCLTNRFAVFLPQRRKVLATMAAGSRGDNSPMPEIASIRFLEKGDSFILRERAFKLLRNSIPDFSARFFC